MIRYRGYYYDSESGLYYLQSRYYDPQVKRFVNADSYVSTGQGLTSTNMFVYCLNNPVNYYDWSGAFPFAIAFAGALVNVATTFIATKVTGQEYTWADAGVAALSGFCNAIPVVGPYISGAIDGVYTGYTSYCNGASIGEAILCGTVSAAATTFSIGNLADFQGNTLDLATTVAMDLTFGTAYNCMSAAVTEGVVNNANYNTMKNETTSIRNPTSTLDVVRRSTKTANTRIVGGSIVVLDSRTSYVDTDDRIYCRVQI